MANAHNQSKTISWTKEEIDDLYDDHDYKMKKYAAKARLIKSNIKKFERVSLLDIQENVLREMNRKFYKSTTFKATFILEREPSSVDMPSPKRHKSKHPRHVMLGHMLHRKRKDEEHKNQKIENENKQKQIDKLEQELRALYQE